MSLHVSFALFPVLNTIFSGVTSYQTQCNTGVCYYPRLSCCPGYNAMVANGTFVCGITPSPNDTAVAPAPGCPTCCPTNGTGPLFPYETRKFRNLVRMGGYDGLQRHLRVLRHTAYE